MLEATIGFDGKIIKEAVTKDKESKADLSELISFYNSKLQEIKKAG